MQLHYNNIVIVPRSRPNIMIWNSVHLIGLVSFRGFVLPNPVHPFQTNSLLPLDPPSALSAFDLFSSSVRWQLRCEVI